jgi:uncharacterized phage infection (PIP) family protein YhgE
MVEKGAPELPGTAEVENAGRVVEVPSFEKQEPRTELQTQIRAASKTTDLPTAANALHDRWKALATIILGVVSICGTVFLAYASKASVSDLDAAKTQLTDVSTKLQVLSGRVDSMEKSLNKGVEALTDSMKKASDDMKAQAASQAASDAMLRDARDRLDRLDGKVDDLLKRAR